jgi:hypothetical protein
MNETKIGSMAELNYFLFRFEPTTTKRRKLYHQHCYQMKNEQKTANICPEISRLQKYSVVTII